MSALLSSVLGVSGAAHAESAAIAENLPLDVQVDLLMTELSRLLKVDDNQGIIELIPRIRSLDIEIPDSLYFLEARALYRTGDALGARDRLVVYLANTGRDGRYYEQATELLLAVKAEAEVQERKLAEEERLRKERLAKSAEKARALRIREAQRYLHQLGFPLAVENGELNKPTREAIAVYQIRRDLGVNGEVTDETLESLKASVPSEHNCDALARYGRTDNEWSIAISSIAHQAAIPACNDALRKYPDVIRFHIQYARALLAADRNDDAMNAIEKAARLGYPAAETTIGWMHEEGRLSGNGKPDYENALRWYRLAAEKDYPEALRSIASLTERGLGGIRRSDEEAIELLTRAATLGYPPAQVELGLKYQAGRGVKRDYGVAMQWIGRAAELNYPDALLAMGEIYERGRGVKRDKTTARSWYVRAENQGHPEASEKLKRL
ncbi:MAG: SEL1-like repeat protein [Pseudomonadales bacterium]|nr:SEL1-like repeat protein [Pseudomonadales bacterium]